MEDFLINKLLRNIPMINYIEQGLISEPHYDYTFEELLIDKEHVQSQLKDIGNC